MNTLAIVSAVIVAVMFSAETRSFLPLIQCAGPEPTSTPTASATLSATLTATATHTITPSATATRTSTPTATRTTTPTPSRTPTSTATSTRTPTPSRTPTDTTPPIGSGDNVVCVWSGATQICAWVSNGSPVQSSSVTVYGRLYTGGSPQSGRAMTATWRYKTTTSSCTGQTGADGIASCYRNIGRATVGYRVDVDVSISGYSATTWFVPQ